MLVVAVEDENSLTVIHSTGTSKNFTKGLLSYSSTNGTKGPGLKIRKEKKTFTKKEISEMEKMCYSDKIKINAAKSVQRAEEHLDEASYNLVLNNCEHFVNWAITGVSISAQVEQTKIIKDAIIAAAEAAVYGAIDGALLGAIGGLVGVGIGAMIGAAVGAATGIFFSLAHPQVNSCTPCAHTAVVLNDRLKVLSTSNGFWRYKSIASYILTESNSMAEKGIGLIKKGVGLLKKGIGLLKKGIGLLHF